MCGGKADYEDLTGHWICVDCSYRDGFDSFDDDIYARLVEVHNGGLLPALEKTLADLKEDAIGELVDNTE